jgi:hypothetical protein
VDWAVGSCIVGRRGTVCSWAERSSVRESAQCVHAPPVSPRLWLAQRAAKAKSCRQRVMYLDDYGARSCGDAAGAWRQFKSPGFR